MTDLTGELVTVRMLRVSPYKGQDRVPGEILRIPDYSARPLLKGSNPRAELVEQGAEAPDESTEIDATPGALKLARGSDLDLSHFSGQGSGPDGRIYVEDVEAWLKS